MKTNTITAFLSCSVALAVAAAPSAAESSGAAATASGNDEWPFIIIRHPRSVYWNQDLLKTLIDVHKRHPGACDEFMLAIAGRPTIAKFEKDCSRFDSVRALCEEAGILPGFQQGETLGHGPAPAVAGPDMMQFPDEAWQRSAGGAVIRFPCPRSPFVLDYERAFAKTVLGIAKPTSYWLDDDLRMSIKAADGCYCDRCIAAFNERYGLEITRKELVKRLYDKDVVQDPIRQQWCDFKAESIALYAETVRQAADELGSDCRLAYQSVSADNLASASSYAPLLAALSGPRHASVGIRPGHGFYTESEPRGMVTKCLWVAREAERCKKYTPGGDEGAPGIPMGRLDEEHNGIVASVCYEQETYTRHFLHKSPGAIMTECALALASGCDSLSLYWFPEESPVPVAEYDRFLGTLSRARPYFERLAASTRRTRLGGLARFVGSAAAQTIDFDLTDKTDYHLACAGVPVTVANPAAAAWYVTGKSRREMTEADKAALAAAPVVDVADMGPFPLIARRKKLLDALDDATGGTFPVRIDECRPLRILPRVREDGRVDSVTLLNLSIGGTDGIKVRVRRPVSRNVLMQDARKASPAPVSCEQGATPDEIVVAVPDIPGWQIVTLFFGEKEEAATASPASAAPAAPAKPDTEWRWYDGANLPMEGRGFAPARLATPYQRLPEDILPRVTKEVRALQADSSGLCFRFKTDSQRLHIFWKDSKPVGQGWCTAPTGYDGVDVYQETPQGWRFVEPPPHAAAKNGGAGYVWKVEPGLTTMVYLPTYNGIAEFRIGVEPGCSVEAAPPRKSGIAKPVVFYGTSITQGASASRPGGCWVAKAARLADVEAVNLGFSGSGKMEDAMLDCIAEIDASLYVLDTVSNMSPGMTAERTEKFVRALAERRPGVPILLTANVWAMGGEARRRDAAVRDVFTKLKTEDPAKWAMLHFAGDDADALAPDDDGTVDGIHLNDLGMKRAGDCFGGVIRGILAP